MIFQQMCHNWAKRAEIQVATQPDVPQLGKKNTLEEKAQNKVLFLDEGPPTANSTVSNTSVLASVSSPLEAL